MLADVTHLRDLQPDLVAYESPIYERSKISSVDKNKSEKTNETTLFGTPGAFCLQEKFYAGLGELQTSLKFLRASASKQIYANPEKTKVAILTSGGIVPGMNVVIRSLVKSLEQEYNVKDIQGVRFGYYGLLSDDDKMWVQLTSDTVSGIQDQGGSVLGTCKVEFDREKVVEILKKRGITQLYVIGGFGTMRGLDEVKECLRRRKENIQLIGIPCTIDNNLPFMDTSFGFMTAI